MQFADTTLALMLSLLRRTHKLAAALARGTWVPAVSQLRGARRCAGLRLVRRPPAPSALPRRKSVGKPLQEVLWGPD